MSCCASDGPKCTANGDAKPCARSDGNGTTAAGNGVKRNQSTYESVQQYYGRILQTSKNLKTGEFRQELQGETPMIMSLQEARSIEYVNMQAHAQLVVLLRGRSER